MTTDENRPEETHGGGGRRYFTYKSLVRNYTSGEDMLLIPHIYIV